MTRVRSGAVALGLAMLLSACSQSAPTTTTDAGTAITVTSTSKAIQLDRATAPAGVVTFKVVNSDGIVHSLVLIKTDVAHDKIPSDPKDASRPDLKGAVRQTGSIPAGATKQFSVTLEAGRYVLVCDEPAHYIIGMHAPFTVQ